MPSLLSLQFQIIVSVLEMFPGQTLLKFRKKNANNFKMPFQILELLLPSFIYTVYTVRAWAFVPVRDCESLDDLSTFQTQHTNSLSRLLVFSASALRVFSFSGFLSSFYVADVLFSDFTYN